MVKSKFIKSPSKNIINMQQFMKYLFVFFIINCTEVYGYDELPRSIAPETSVYEQEQAVFGLIQRVVGNETAKKFVVHVNRSMEFRSFKIFKNPMEELLHIDGWDGVSVAKGFHYYLKYVLIKDVSWFKNTIELNVNDSLPNIMLVSKSASPIIYYQNVCTWGYSFAWWNWSTWRRHIDWMAMMGISLTIAPIQEAIWHDVYKELGLSEEEVSAHFAGPAFQAWQRMGNIRGWAGPLPESYRRMQLLLQQQIIRAQRALGISVALPAFAGHVPVAFKRLYPNVNFSTVERWNNFPDQYCCDLFIEPTEPLFTGIGTKFLEKIVASYGANHIYFSDPFNEVNPRIATPAYLNSTAFHIYESMRQVDAKSIWLLQGWMFVKNQFWSDNLIEAFLKAVPQGKLLVLDLQSEQFPQYQRTYSYYGQPFIWCMLHNFGGTLGMFGSVNVVNKAIRTARQMTNSSMIGVGITPEGIHQNYAVYSLALERGWEHDDFNLNTWFTHFAAVRYGVQDSRSTQAWLLLQQSVYSYNGLRKMRGKYTITRRPALNLDVWTWYNHTDVQQALELLLSINNVPNQASYLHDLVDITRQYLQNMADFLYLNLKSAYRKHQLQRFTYIAQKLSSIFRNLEAILATNEHFLLGTWLASAKSLANTKSEAELYEFNARNQITTWGPSGQILDYATKQWSGIVSDYYHQRWLIFLNETQTCLAEKHEFNSTAFKLQVSEQVEKPFSFQTKIYPTSAKGDTWQVAQHIYDTWKKRSQNQKFLLYNSLKVKLRTETHRRKKTKDFDIMYV